MPTLTRKGVALADRIDRKREFIGIDAVRELSAIHRLAVTHQRLSEDVCNGCPQWATRSPYWEDRDGKWLASIERRIENCETAIKRHVAALGPGWGVVFQGDPRGCTVKLVCPNGYTDDWGREGACVYVEN